MSVRSMSRERGSILPYLRGGLMPSAETSSVGPVRNPEVPEGCHNLLEALANLKREDH